MSRHRASLVVLLIATVCVACSSGDPPTVVAAPASCSDGGGPKATGSASGVDGASVLEKVELVRVVAGDVIEVRFGDGRTDIVCYIGVEGPRPPEGTKAGEPFGQEALEANAALLASGNIFVEADGANRDQSGRRRRHVWVGQPPNVILVTENLARRGLARVLLNSDQVKYIDLLEVAQSAARSASIGVWMRAETP